MTNLNGKAAGSLLADTARPDEREMKLSMGIIILGVILFGSSAYPGIFHGDGTNVLRYVLAGRWSDWHPITYYAFVYLCMAVIKHPFMVILVQIVLFVFTQYIVLKYLKTYARKYACYIYTGIVFTVGISTLTYLYVFYKDTPHFIGILGFIVSLLAYVKGSREKKDILLANWRYLCRYPFNYLTDFFTINSLVWEMATPIDGYEWIQSVFVNGDNTLVT